MTIEEMARSYAEGYNKEYQQIAYDSFLCGYDAKCGTESPEGLEEAAEEYRRESYKKSVLPNIDGPMSEYGGSIKDAFIVGAKWDRVKMMKESMEGIAHPDDCEIWVNLIGYGYKFKDGDKVRVIVIKEE